MNSLWKALVVFDLALSSPVPNHNSNSNIQQQAFGVPLAYPGNSVNSFHQNRFKVNQLQQIPHNFFGRRPSYPVQYSNFYSNRIIPYPVRPVTPQINYKEMTFEERFEYCDIYSGKFDSNIPSAKEGDQNQVRVILILDETGSMGPNKENTITAYNEFLAKQKEESDNNNSEETGSGKFSGENEDEDLGSGAMTSPRYSLIKFDTDMKIDNSASILESPNLTYETYQPDGSTALYDAIGCTIQAYKKEMFNILVILTDGEENSSKIFDRADTKKMIDDMVENQKWQVQYLGANQDAFSVAGSIGIANAVGYVADAAGFQSSFGAAARFSKQQSRSQYKLMMDFQGNN